MESAALIVQEQVLVILNAGDNAFVAGLQSQTIKTLAIYQLGNFGTAAKKLWESGK